MKELFKIFSGKKKEKFDYPKIQQPLRELKKDEYNEWCMEFRVSSSVERNRFFSF